MEFTGEVHPFAAVFPMLADDEIHALAESIAANGLIEAVKLDDDGRLVDGRNRLVACELAGVTPRYERYPGDDAVAYILAANVDRRHLTKGARAMAYALAYPDPARLKRKRSRSSVTEELSDGKISEARTVYQYAPELVDAVMAGGSLQEAWEIAATRRQQAEQDRRQLANLRRRYPELAARVDADLSTLEQALTAAAALDAEAEYAGIRDDVRLLREELGSPVPWPASLPDMTVDLIVQPNGQITPANPLDQSDALERERALLRQLIAIRNQLRNIADEPPIDAAWWPDGQVNAVRAAGSAIVEAAARLVESYNRAASVTPVRMITSRG